MKVHVVAKRCQNNGGKPGCPTGHLQTTDRMLYFNLHIQNCVPNVQCCGLEKSLSKKSMITWFKHGKKSPICVNQIWSHCIIWMGMTQSEPSATQNSWHTVWAQSCMC